MNPNEKVRPHFTWGELMCRCGCGRMEMKELTLDRLEIARLILRRGITIESAYRCPDHEETVSGQRKGPHVEGYAVDLRKPNGGAAYASLDAAMRKAGFWGFGSGGRHHPHYDDAPDLLERPRPGKWDY